jgi:hypothetical protein
MNAARGDRRVAAANQVGRNPSVEPQFLQGLAKTVRVRQLCRARIGISNRNPQGTGHGMESAQWDGTALGLEKSA